MQNYIWLVYFNVIGSFTEVVLTYNRLLPDGRPLKFDEDPDGILDLSTNQDDHLVMDGFLALIPDQELLSCSLRAVRSIMLVWEHGYYQHVFAGFDKQKVKAAFDRRLWNPDSSADFLFIGGDSQAHTTPAIEHWTNELLHTASLIHDDILDNAGVRRGKESVHIKWGPNITVLLGDYLYIKSIGLSLQSRHERVIRLLADVSARMIEGELDEYAMAGDLRITEEQYLGIVENKTAVLFGACCRIGAILGLASPEEEEAVAAYGLNLGKTFQIVDDLLDFTGDAKVVDKPVLSDLGEGRITLPVIQSLKGGGRAGRQRIKALVGRKDVPADDRRALVESLAAGGAFDYANGRAREFAEKALEAIHPFPETGPRETLVRLALFGLLRNK